MVRTRYAEVNLKENRLDFEGGRRYNQRESGRVGGHLRAREAITSRERAKTMAEMNEGTKEFYERIGELIGLTGSTVGMLFENDPHFVGTFQEALNARIELISKYREDVYENVKSETGQLTLRLLREVANSLLEEP